MSTTYSRSREQLARIVLRKLGVLASGGADVSADMELVYEAMDLRLKEDHRLGIVWSRVNTVPITFSLSASTLSASATGDILFPLTMTVVDSSQDEPVDIIDIREYAKIEDKAEAGLPIKALWRGTAEFFFWPVPTAATTAKLTYEQISDDTSASLAPDLQIAMIRGFKDILAYDLSDEFGVDEAKVKRLKAESELAERNIRKLSVQRVDYSTVRVDEYDDRERRETDYGR